MWSDLVMEGVEADAINDIHLLRILDQAIGDAEQHAARLRDARMEAVARLRDEGHNMGDIAGWAGVTPSYLSRILLRKGVPRRGQRRAAWR